MFGATNKFEDSITEDANTGNAPSKFNAKTLLNSTLKFGIANRS